MYYYLPDIDGKYIPEEFSAHFFSTRVCEGDVLTVCDHKNSAGKIQITELNKKTKEIKYDLLEKNTYPKNEVKKVLFQAIPDKQYLDKLAEVVPIADIDEVILFQSDFSPNYNINWSRIDKILIRSTEQCQRLSRPIIRSVCKKELEELLIKFSPAVLDVCGQEYDGVKQHSSVLVGPEGGWSKNELNQFRDQNLDIIKTGNLVLPAWIAGYSYLS